MKTTAMKFKFAVEPGRLTTAILAGVAILSILIATLYPFNPYPRNRVSWVNRSNGLTFDRPGLALSDRPLSFYAAPVSSCTLELFIRPANLISASTIIGFYSPHSTKQLLVGQYYGTGLMITHDARIESDQTETIEVDVAHIFRPGVPVVISILSGSNGTTVYAYGSEQARFPQFTISQADMSGQIVIGTSPVGYDPWQGELLGLAIYGKELSPADVLKHETQWSNSKGSLPDLRHAIAGYMFSERVGREVRNEVTSGPDLHIPATFSVPYKAFLQSPATEFKADGSYVSDILANIAGFVPLGLVLCAFFIWTRGRSNAIFTAVIVCGMLSIIIEMLQYYIAPRGSGITDVITNTLGAAIGASLLQSNVVRHVLRYLKIIPPAV